MVAFYGYYLLSVYYVIGSEPGTFISSSFLTTTLGGRYQLSHFIDGEIEGQRTLLGQGYMVSERWSESSSCSFYYAIHAK